MSERIKNRTGRPPTKQNLFKHPLANSLIKELAQRGATDIECAARMLVSLRTWARWKQSNRDFWHALCAKEDLDDASVEQALLESARGFTKTVTRVEGSVTIVEERYFPPNVAATAFYLKNRKPEKWRDKIDIAASMEQIPVRINFKRKEQAIEAESKNLSEEIGESNILDAQSTSPENGSEESLENNE